MKSALITGITGQDGSYLAEFLLDKDYEVHGIIRRASLFNTDRIDHIYRDPHVKNARLHLHYGDLCESSSLRHVIDTVQPDEIYNLGAQSHVKVSFELPEYTSETVAMGTLRLLEAMRNFTESTGKQVRFYQAGSSEMFGATPPPQNERTPFHPRSPYAVGKVAGHYHTINYREAYGIFASNGILFNHESPRRGETFVTRKITRAATRIKLGLQEKLYLGNMEARRDWGYAKDYVEAMWLMLQQDEPDDYIVATGKDYSVQQFAEAVFESLDIDWRDFIEIDPRYLRPAEVGHLNGDASKARQSLGWEPRVSFEELVRMMVEHDLELADKERILKKEGYEGRQRG